MKPIINTKIKNSVYGTGTITAIGDNNVMTIVFPLVGEKRFKYPDAFCKSIQTDDEEIQQEAERSWMKILEEKEAQKAREIEAREEEIRNNVNNILNNLDDNIVFDGETNRIFIVHQGLTYQNELAGQYVWAPASGIHHHEKMTEIHTGDIIFHYSEGAIQSVSEALCDCFNSPQPAALSGHGWASVGYRAQLRYQVLSSPQSLVPIQTIIAGMRAPIYSSFDKDGNANQGYIYDLEHDIAKIIKDQILTVSQPVGVISVLNRIR